MPLGRLGQRENSTQHPSGDGFYSFLHSEACAGGRVSTGAFAGELHNPLQRAADSERCFAEETHSSALLPLKRLQGSRWAREDHPAG